ncbi:hypothetical protein, partial [Saccharibacter floricola]|uniref:hypothetical protein n=1 Tax=Saccharibacter floricola TaxID=231053 RepID=UPI0022329971
VSDELGPYTDKNGVHHKGVLPGLDDRDVTNNWARIALETAGNAGIAAATGGNVGQTIGATVSGKVAGTLAAYSIGYNMGYLLNNKTLSEFTANLLDNALSTGAGAAVGAILGGKSGNVLNNAIISSILHQYNETAQGDIQKAVALGIAAQYIHEVIQGEVRHHAGTGYVDGLDGMHSYWQKDGTIGGVIPDEYVLPTDDTLKQSGIENVATLHRMLYHPGGSGLEAVLYFPKDPTNSETPPLLVFKETTRSC